MKKHILFFSLITVLFIGCSKDDDSSGYSEIPANEKFFNEGKNQDGTKTKFSLKYNTDKNVERLELGTYGMFVYKYDGSKIIGMDAFLKVNSSFTFTYDDDGHIIAFTENGQTTEVFYNPELQSYLYEKANGDQETIFVDADGDPKKFVYYNKLNDASYTTTMTYDLQNKKGIFTNTNNPMLASCIAAPSRSVYFYSFSLTKKPIKSVEENDYVSEYENTYDEQGFLETSAHPTFEGPVFNHYNYIRL